MPMRIAITYDVPGWAFHQLAAGLAMHAPENAVVSLVCERDGAICEADIQFYLSWISAPPKNHSRLATLVTSAGVLYEEYDPEDWNTNIVTDLRNARAAREKLPRFDAVLAANRALYAACSGMTHKTYLTPIGVNDALFRPRPQRRASGGKLRVGWCGNPAGRRSVKGYQEILLPLMRKLGDAHYSWHVNDRNWTNALTWRELAEWYNDLDVFLCTSINEGSPNTIFEAAACGVTVISTEVGMCDDWGELRQAGLIVPSYKNPAARKVTFERIAELLDSFRRNPENLSVHGAALRASIENRYSWKKLAARWYSALMGDEIRPEVTK
jgi:hypothetical protein